MRLQISTAVLLLIVVCSHAQTGPEDLSLSSNPDEDRIFTDRLPGGPTQSRDNDYQQMTEYNSRELPELSSGVLGTVVYNESLFLSGAYRTASEGGRSYVRRVRIPNYAMFRIERIENEELTVQMKRTYYFNITLGLWEETIDTDNYYVRSVMGVHAKYSRTFFHAFSVLRKKGGGSETVKLQYSSHHIHLLNPKNFTEDFTNFDANREDNYDDIEKLDYLTDGASGSKRKLNVRNGLNIQSLTVFYNGPQGGKSADAKLQVDFQRDERGPKEEIFMITVAGSSSEEQSALNEYKEFQDMAASNWESLLTSHTDRWRERFEDGDIEVEGSGPEYARMRRIVKSSLFQLYSQFPFRDRYAFTETNTGSTVDDEDMKFNGLSATGLGRAGNSSERAVVDFGGHVTADQELFDFLPIALLQPELARQILYYRTRSLQSNTPPVPFEADGLGQAITPVYCGHCETQAAYPTGLLGLAVRHFHAITQDETWLKLANQGGVAILDKVGRYFDSKIQPNTTRGGDYYSITGVCGPDELHSSQTNNLFTNSLAALAVHYWKYARCVGEFAEDQSIDKTLDKARKLAFAFIPDSQKNEQFEGFFGALQQISQADTMLTYFPASWNMSGRWLEDAQGQRLTNDLSTYGSISFTSTNPDSPNSNIPTTALANRAITRMQLGTASSLSQGQQDVDNLWRDYASQPFYVWRNNTGRYDHSAAGHLGSAAAFLETIMFGFGGLRVRSGRLDILRPSLPTSLTSITIKGMHFYGGEIDYKFDSSSVSLTSRGGQFATSMLFYDKETNQYSSFSSQTKTLPQQESAGRPEDIRSSALYSIISNTNFNCPLDDRNYNSQNPYFQAAVSFRVSYVLLLVTAVFATFF